VVARSTIAVVSSVAMVAAVLPPWLGSSASASAPPAIAFPTQPGNGDPGSVLATAPAVTLQNGASSSIELSLNPVALSGQYVTGALGGCSRSTSSGVVTFSG